MKPLKAVSSVNLELPFGCIANGVRQAASVTAAIGLRGCLHRLRRAEMMTALVFGFLVNL
jgi:hypothetical protein